MNNDAMSLHGAAGNSVRRGKGPVDVLAVLADVWRRTDLPEDLLLARQAVAELQRLVLAIDDECGNAKPDFGRVVKLAAEAGVLARSGSAS